MIQHPLLHQFFGILSVLICYYLPGSVMHELIILWCILASLTLLLMWSRYSGLLYILLFIPFIFAIGYAFAKNARVSEETVIGGHRGSPESAPENSLAAMKAAMEEGCQLVEFDIQLTSDGIPVVMHDDSTFRTTGINKKISKSLASEIIGMPLNSVNNINETLPTMEEVVDFCVQNGLKMLFDVKRMNDVLLKELVRTIQEKNLYTSAIISSFSPDVPYFIKKADPKILTGFTNRRALYGFLTEDASVNRGVWWNQWFLEFLDDLMLLVLRSFILPEFLGVDMLLLNHRDISQSIVSEAEKRGMQVVAWTVNDQKQLIWMRDVLRIPVLTDFPKIAK